MNLDDYNEVRRTKVLLYGPPKSGKTALLAALAEAGYTLWWMDMENGVKTLMNPAILKPEFRKNVRLINIPDHRALPLAFDAVRQAFKAVDSKFCFLHGKVNCPICLKEPGAKYSDALNLSKFTDNDILVIDSWTQVSNSALNKLTLKNWQKDDEYKPTWDDFRAQGMYLDELLSKIQVANVNICVLSHEIDVEKSETKEKIVPVGGTRNFSKTMAKYFDVVMYAQVLNKKHSIYAASTWSNTVMTGSRVPVADSASKDSEEASIVAIFKGGVK